MNSLRILSINDESEEDLRANRGGGRDKCRETEGGSADPERQREVQYEQRRKGTWKDGIERAVKGLMSLRQLADLNSS